MPFQVGERVGDYEVLQILGVGGMGQVYKVRNVLSDRVEAMKVLLPNLESDPELVDRFIREIKVQASLDHPNIAGLHTAQRLGNQLVMMMEYVEGHTIENELRAGPLPLEKGIEYIRQVLSALSYAHSRGVVHRDIKPANMMLTAQGHVKLMDFGIAKMAADRKLTQTGRTVGSLYYMSPEQINGALDLDARSDLYSLGVSLYEMVTGKRPFQGDSDYSVMAAHLNSSPVPPIQIDPNLPSALNDIILMSIFKDPGQRFQSADAFRAALESVQKPAPWMTVAATPTRTLNNVPPPTAAQSAGSSRRGIWMAVGSLVTVGVLAVAALQGPKWFGTRAAGQLDGGAAQVQQAQPQTTEPPAQTPVTPEQAQPSNAQPTGQVAEQSSAPSGNQATQTNRPTQQKLVQSSQGSGSGVQTSTAPAQVVQQPAVESAQPSVSSAAQNSPASLASQNTEAVRDVRDLFMKVASRANAARSSLTRLEQSQARSGLGLRNDIVSARQRLEIHLDEVESALKIGDAARAKSSLSSAERDLEKIESFLGL